MMTVSIAASSSAASALNALGVGMAVSTHNIANVNTAGFHPQEVVYQTGAGGQGVQAYVMPPFPSEAAQRDAAIAAQQIPPEYVTPSGTDLAREFAAMMSTQRAFEANALVIRTWDETLGVLVDIKV